MKLNGSDSGEDWEWGARWAWPYTTLISQMLAAALPYPLTAQQVWVSRKGVFPGEGGRGVASITPVRIVCIVL